MVDNMITKMNNRQTRFIKLLEEIFEIDKSDLDFGIYRILNIKRAEITKFFREQLPKLIEQELKPFASAGNDEIKKQLASIEAQFGGKEMIAQLSSTMPIVAEYNQLQKQLVSGFDMAALESDVYSALFSFFNRYYDEGDFISKRRYKEGVYALPYEGEEVKLYWANQDQYYIKTSENFRDYTFMAEDITVHFRLVDATTEQNNNKEDEKEKRVFMLFEEDEEQYPGIKTFSYDPEAKELIIRFIYDIPQDKKRKYAEENYKAITQYIVSEHTELVSRLLKDIPAAKGFKTLIQKHLERYVAKNTFDYFIHKDLKGFLSRELDFYIKNEIFHIDDIDSEDVEHNAVFFAKIRAIKKVARIIIDFLAQLENFQKRLWLKKKFVVETNWCITLDHIDESFYPEIVANEAQTEDWVNLFAIDKIEADLHTPAFSRPLTVDFLKANKNLVLNTRHFSHTFRDKVIASIDGLDDKANGVLVHADNSQGVRFLVNKYQNSIQTVYIDPPYNTPFSQILYKNNYKHSSWLSLLNNCIPYIVKFFTKDFTFGLAIDDYEFVNLASFLDMSMPNYERSVVVVNHHPQGAGGRVSRTHEYYIIISKPDKNAPKYLGEPLDDYQEDRSFMRSGSAENNFRYGRWNSFYALLVDPKTNKIVSSEDPIPLGENYPLGPNEDGYRRIYPINSRGEERVWRSSFKTGRKRAENGELYLSPKGTVYQSIDHEAKRETLFSNWTDAKYNAGIYGANILADMGVEFDYPKSINTMETAIWAQTFGRENGLVFDFFAGSGTTANAVININRKFGGNRRYLLIDMGEHFYTTIIPRISKAVYSDSWKDRLPKNRTTGISQIVKYMRLESYEDALSNVQLKENHASINFGEEYMIHYMLDVESKDSLLNTDKFNEPFNFAMFITERNERKTRNIDVVETFNYLIGLNVDSKSTISIFSAETAAKPAYEGAVDLRKDSNGQFMFQQLEGTLPDGRRALVIWRNVTEDILKSNAALDAYFQKYRINPRDREYDIIFVNGDNNLENLRLYDETWKVVMTEQEFNKQMWEES